MNIRALRAFRAIVAEGSVGAAAHALALSQPAVSRLISLLEAELDLPLFRREHRRLVLTEQGAAFAREAGRILAHLDEIPRIAAEIRTTHRRRLRLVTMPRTALSVVTPAVARFVRENPDVDVSLDLRARREMELWITGRDYDFGFGNVPVVHRAALGEPLVRSVLQVLMPADHPLAAHAVVHAADLADVCLVAQFPGLLLRRQTDEILGAAEVTPRRTVLAGSSQVAEHLVAGGAGVTIIDRLSTLTLDPARVTLRPLIPARWVSFGVIRPRDGDLDATSQAMIGYLRAEIARHLLPGAIELPD